MIKKFRAAIYLIFSMALGSCGGGGSGTTVSCKVTGISGFSFAKPGPAYVGTQFLANSANLSFVTPPCTTTYSATGLPPGLAISSGGVVSGVPVAAGQSTASITFTGNGTDGSTASAAVNVVFDVFNAVSWTTKVSNHGLGNLLDQQLVAIGSTLYVVGSKLTGSDYVPQLYQSTDGGATWVDLINPPPGLPSLRSFSVMADATSLYLVGGKTSNALVTTQASFTFNNAVLRFVPGAPGAWSTVAANPFAGGGMVSPAVLANGGKLYVQGGTNSNATSQLLYVSTNLGTTWTNVGATGSPYLSGHCLTANAGALYLIGGTGGLPSPFSNSNNQGTYKSTNDGLSWIIAGIRIPSLQEPALANLAACTSVGGRIFATGGRDATGTAFSNRVYQTYDGVTWGVDPISSVFGVRSAHGMTALNGKLIAFGGVNALGSVASVIEGTP